MRRFTIAFIYNTALTHVLLMHKNRPAWQAGKINGIGGKLEDGETPLECITRETFEETNLKIPQKEWRFAGIMQGDDWKIDVFCLVYTKSMDDAKTMEDQEVAWIPVTKLPDNVVPNLRWLVPMCLDMAQTKDIDSFIATFNKTNKT